MLDVPMGSPLSAAAGRGPGVGLLYCTWIRATS